MDLTTTAQRHLERLEPYRHICLLLGLDRPDGEWRTTRRVGEERPPSPVWDDWRTRRRVVDWQTWTAGGSESGRLVVLAKKGICERRAHGRTKGTANPIIEWRLTDLGIEVLHQAELAGKSPLVPPGWQPNYTTSNEDT